MITILSKVLFALFFDVCTYEVASDWRNIWENMSGLKVIKIAERLHMVKQRGTWRTKNFIWKHGGILQSLAKCCDKNIWKEKIYYCSSFHRKSGSIGLWMKEKQPCLCIIQDNFLYKQKETKDKLYHNCFTPFWRKHECWMIQSRKLFLLEYTGLTHYYLFNSILKPKPDYVLYWA